ncbi:MAG: cupin domain-containing protein [Natronomonas sp.]
MEPFVKRRQEIEYESVSAAPGLNRGILVGPAEGNSVSIRRFTLDPGAEVPRHTNEIEHQQYVLSGGYVVGIGDEEYTVEAGDVVSIPAGVVHWYHNPGESEGAFLCAVPTGDDSITLVD